MVIVPYVAQTMWAFRIKKVTTPLFVRVVLAEDHRILRGKLRLLLDTERDLRVVGEAENGHEALKLAEELRPDVLLADVSMPGPDGIEVTRILRQRIPETRVIILTLYEDDYLITEALEAGAWGFVHKRVADTQLIGAIRSAAGGRAYRRPEKDINADTQLPQACHLAALDQAESEMMRLLVRGRSNAQIAETLNLDLNEVERRRAQLLGHLGLASRVQLVHYALEQGLA
jgi:two-component system, NarL family, response regulator NreC